MNKDYELIPVRNMNTLKMLERAGHITLHEQTGTKITGLYSSEKFTCYYIDDFVTSRFQHKGKYYGCEYVSGCFCPYVFELK